MARRKSTGSAKKRTSMFLSADGLKAAARKAEKLGISRSMYVDQLIRQDTKLAVGVDLDEPAKPASVFG